MEFFDREGVLDLEQVQVTNEITSILPALGDVFDAEPREGQTFKHQIELAFERIYHYLRDVHSVLREFDRREPEELGELHRRFYDITRVWSHLEVPLGGLPADIAYMNQVKAELEQLVCDINVYIETLSTPVPAELPRALKLFFASLVAMTVWTVGQSMHQKSGVTGSEGIYMAEGSGHEPQKKEYIIRPADEPIIRPAPTPGEFKVIKRLKPTFRPPIAF